MELMNAQQTLTALVEGKKVKPASMTEQANYFIHLSESGDLISSTGKPVALMTETQYMIHDESKATPVTRFIWAYKRKDDSIPRIEPHLFTEQEAKERFSDDLEWYDKLVPEGFKKK